MNDSTVRPPDPPHRFNLSTWALEHQALVVLLLILVSLAGILSYGKLGQSEDPPFTFKVMVVRTIWPGATAARSRSRSPTASSASCRRRPTSTSCSSYSKPGESLLFFTIKDSAPASAGARHLVPGAQEGRRHRAPRCPPACRGRTSTTSSATSTPTSTRSPATASRYARAEGIRRSHARRAAARARRRQGRFLRRAGAEDLRRDLERQARDARR